eukprot:757709-Hanusia_phi.AAC.3
MKEAVEFKTEKEKSDLIITMARNKADRYEAVIHAIRLKNDLSLSAVGEHAFLCFVPPSCVSIEFVHFTCNPGLIIGRNNLQKYCPTDMPTICFLTTACQHLSRATRSAPSSPPARAWQRGSLHCGLDVLFRAVSFTLYPVIPLRKVPLLCHLVTQGFG